MQRSLPWVSRLRTLRIKWSALAGKGPLHLYKWQLVKDAVFSFLFPSYPWLKFLKNNNLPYTLLIRVRDTQSIKDIQLIKDTQPTKDIQLVPRPQMSSMSCLNLQPLLASNIVTNVNDTQYLPYWLEIIFWLPDSVCTLCSGSTWKEDRVWRVWNYYGNRMSSFVFSPERNMVSFFLGSLPIWSYLPLVSPFDCHRPSCLSHLLDFSLDTNVRCSRCGVSLPK